MYSTTCEGEAPSLQPARMPALHSVLAAGGVVSGAGLDFVVLLVLDFEFAVGAVDLQIGRDVSDVVLAAEFGGYLIEGFAELVELVAYDDVLVYVLFVLFLINIL